MLVVFPAIFVAETKIIYGYNFVVPLSNIIGLFHSMKFYVILKFFSPNF